MTNINESDEKQYVRSLLRRLNENTIPEFLEEKFLVVYHTVSDGLNSHFAFCDDKAETDLGGILEETLHLLIDEYGKT